MYTSHMLFWSLVCTDQVAPSTIQKFDPRGGGMMEIVLCTVVTLSLETTMLGASQGFDQARRAAGFVQCTLNEYTLQFPSTPSHSLSSVESAPPPSPSLSPRLPDFLFLRAHSAVLQPTGCNQRQDVQARGRPPRLDLRATRQVRSTATRARAASFVFS